MKEQFRAKLLLAGSMAVFGTIGIFRRYIPLGSSVLAMTRGFIGMLTLLLIMRVQRKRLAVQDIRRALLPLLASGVAMGADWILLFEAYNYTSIAVATLCYYMAPIFVIAASPFCLGERITGKKLLCILLAVAGMVFVSGVLQEGDASYTGVLLGLGAAVFYAAVIVINKKIQGVSAYDKTVVQLATAGTVLLPYVLLTETGAHAALTPPVIGLVLLVGAFHTGATYAVYFASIEKLPAQTVALFSYIDPALAVLLSAWVLREPLGGYELMGIVLILGATLLSELPERTPAKSAA